MVKKVLLVCLLFLLVSLSLVLAQSTNPWSADSAGKEKNDFTTEQKVYVKGISICNLINGMARLYIVEDKEWKEGDELIDVRDTPQDVETDENAALPTTLIWEEPEVGDYDILIDCNGNMEYDNEPIDSIANIGFSVKGIAGKGKASLGNNTPSDHTWRYPGEPNEMLQLLLEAEGEVISLKNISIKAEGDGSDLDVEKIEVYVDENNDGKKEGSKIGEGSYSSDNGNAVIPINYELEGSKNILIVYSMNSDALGNFSFSVTSLSGVGKFSKEKIKFSGLPLDSATKGVLKRILCEGNLALGFIPNPVEAGKDVKASFSGLKNCSGKTVRVQTTPCDSTGRIMCSCVYEDGCDCSFASESNHTYSGCVDKNNDNDMTDSGESVFMPLGVFVAAGEEPEEKEEEEETKPIFEFSNTTLIIAGFAFFTLLLIVMLIVLIVIATRLPSITGSRQSKSKNKTEKKPEKEEE